MTISWEKARIKVVTDFGKGYDGEPDDDKCFFCPECHEPLYEDDFPEFDCDNGIPICPVCDFRFD